MSLDEEVKILSDRLQKLTEEVKNVGMRPEKYGRLRSEETALLICDIQVNFHKYTNTNTQSYKYSSSYICLLGTIQFCRSVDWSRGEHTKTWSVRFLLICLISVLQFKPVSFWIYLLWSHTKLEKEREHL